MYGLRVSVLSHIPMAEGVDKDDNYDHSGNLEDISSSARKKGHLRNSSCRIWLGNTGFNIRGEKLRIFLGVVLDFSVTIWFC